MRLLPRAKETEVNVGDVAFRHITGIFSSLAPVLLILFAVTLLVSSIPALRTYGISFVFSRDWNPVEGAGEAYGALPFVFGTLVTSFMALFLAVPLSLGVGIFLSELAPRPLRTPLSLTVELLAAVPSVVYGLFGFFMIRPILLTTVEPWLANTLGFLPLFRGAPIGNDMLLASVVLAIMILPTISSITREVLRAVPSTLREGALALGATPWEVIRFVVLPYAKSGIVGAVILGLGRALGETMAVTMLIGNKPQIAGSLFEPAATMASIIANQYPEAKGMQLHSLTLVGFLLFLLALLLNVFARLLVWKTGRLARGAA